MANELAVVAPKVPARTAAQKRSKFVELANIRAVAAIDALRRLGNLSKGNYEYSDEQVAKLEKAINEAKNAAFSALANRNKAKAKVGNIL